MIIPPAPPAPAFDAVSPPVLRDRQRAFLEVLGRAARKTPSTDARAAAEEFVALAFVQPLLKDLRNSSWGAAPFAPSAAEKSLRALADAQLARDLVRAGRWPIVDRLARDLQARSGSAGAGPEASS